MHKLAAHVHDVVIMRRDSEGIRPVHANLHLASVSAHRSIRPYTYGTGVPDAYIESFRDSRVASCPGDVWIYRIGSVPPRFAATTGCPIRCRNAVGAKIVAGAAHRGPILHLAVHVIRNSRIGCGVVDLRDWQANASPFLTPHGGDHDSAVVTD